MSQESIEENLSNKELAQVQVITGAGQTSLRTSRAKAAGCSHHRGPGRGDVRGDDPLPLHRGPLKV